MLADPGFVEAEVIQPFDQLDVAANGERRIVSDAMKRSEKDAEDHTLARHALCPHRWPATVWNCCLPSSRQG